MGEDAFKTTTAEALLGLLSLGPRSGYELRSLIERSIGNFWSESFGQIYPTLKKLEKDGLVECQENIDGGRLRKQFALTEAGRQRLQDWLGVEARPRLPRNEVLLKLFFGDRAEAGASRRQVEAARDAAKRDMVQCVVTEEEMVKTWGKHPALPYWRMTLDYGRTEAEARLVWAERTLLKLNEMDGVRGRSYPKKQAD